MLSWDNPRSITTDQMVNIRPDLRSYSWVSYLEGNLGDIDEQRKQCLWPSRQATRVREETRWAMHTHAEMLMRYGYNQEATEWYKERLCGGKTNYPFAIAGLGKLAIKANDFNEAGSPIERCN